MSNGKCFCPVTTDPYEIAELQLLCEINAVAGTGGGGSGSVLSGAGAPVADPGVSNAIYTDTTTGNQWYWYAGAWH